MGAVLNCGLCRARSTRTGSYRIGRCFGVRQPAQRFFDEGVGTHARRSECALRTHAVGRQVGGAQGDRHTEGTAVLRHTFSADYSAVELREFLHECETDAAAFMCATMCVLNAVETLKQS